MCWAVHTRPSQEDADTEMNSLIMPTMTISWPSLALQYELQHYVSSTRASQVCVCVPGTGKQGCRGQCGPPGLRAAWRCPHRGCACPAWAMAVRGAAGRPGGRCGVLGCRAWCGAGRRCVWWLPVPDRLTPPLFCCGPRDAAARGTTRRAAPHHLNTAKEA